MKVFKRVCVCVCVDGVHMHSPEACTEAGGWECRYGFIVMDGNGSLFGTLSGNTREVRPRDGARCSSYSVCYILECSVCTTRQHKAVRA